MKKFITALVAGLALVIAGGGVAHATTSPPPYVLVLWIQDDAANLFPQTIVSSQEQGDLSLTGLDQLAVDGCYQADIYKNDAITAALIAGGKLYGAENPDESWPGDGSYQSSYSKVWCVTPPEPSEPNAAASIEASCGAFTATLTNELGEVPSRLTASAVVYIDGVFHEALAAAGGQSATSSGSFDEDSGEHHVEVRTGPAFGDALLAEVTVLSDCITPPTVDEPEVVIEEKVVSLASAGPEDVPGVAWLGMGLAAVGAFLVARRRIFG